MNYSLLSYLRERYIKKTAREERDRERKRERERERERERKRERERERGEGERETDRQTNCQSAATTNNYFYR